MRVQLAHEGVLGVDDAVRGEAGEGGRNEERLAAAWLAARAFFAATSPAGSLAATRQGCISREGPRLTRARPPPLQSPLHCPPPLRHLRVHRCWRP
jgi:hypothetical protein